MLLEHLNRFIVTFRLLILKNNKKGQENMKLSLLTVMEQLKKMVDVFPSAEVEDLSRHAKTYFEAMKNIDEIKFKNACTYWVLYKKKFPLIADLREICENYDKNQSDVRNTGAEKCEYNGGTIRLKNHDIIRLPSNQGIILQKCENNRVPSLDAWLENINQNELKASYERTLKDFGFRVCQWHQIVVDAHIWPNSNVSILYKDLIKEKFSMLRIDCNDVLKTIPQT